MTEHSLVESLVGYLRKRFPSYVIWKINDRFTHGIPDIIVSGNGRTSHWEVKHADPDFQSDGIQELTMKRLAHTGVPAHYLIFQTPLKITYIVEPRHLAVWETAGAWMPGIDFDYVGDTIARIHSCS